VALAAVLAIGIDVGIFCGLLAQKGEEPNQQALPQAEAPQTPGATEKAPRHDHQKHETTKDKHDVSDKDHPQEAPTTIDITNSGLVAKAIKENQEQAAPDTPSTSPRTVPETETPDPETSAPTPEETPEEPKPTPTNEEPLPTPTDTGESVPPTQEVTPTIKDTGSGTATAMPSSIMSTLVVVQP